MAAGKPRVGVNDSQPRAGRRPRQHHRRGRSGCRALPTTQTAEVGWCRQGGRAWNL